MAGRSTISTTAGLGKSLAFTGCKTLTESQPPMACGQGSAFADLSFTAPRSVGAGRHPAWNAWRGRFQSGGIQRV